MSYYITEFDIGTDLEQPHNFVKINGKSPIFHFPMKYIQQPNYTERYQWINLSDFGLNESCFDSVLTKREFEANVTTVIINSSTAKLKMEFVKNDLLVETNDAKRQELKWSLLILDKDASKPIQIYNLQNGPGESFVFILSNSK